MTFFLQAIPTAIVAQALIVLTYLICFRLPGYNLNAGKDAHDNDLTCVSACWFRNQIVLSCVRDTSAV